MYSHQRSPGATKECIDPCKNLKEKDDIFSSAVENRIESLTGRPKPAANSADMGPCQKQALALGPTISRFNRYRETLPYAGAANDMNSQLGATEKDKDKPVKADCLTRLPVKADELCRELGLKPGSIKDVDLRDETTGFRAVMYRDESSGKLILVARDTQPKSLVDWQTNILNGQGRDTDQYKAMRELSGQMKDENIDFNVAGYSKGGGLAQEAALINTKAQAYVFNASGLHENSLSRTGTTDFKSLESRTQAFSASNDFLTFMNETIDPQQQIENSQFLRRELAGDNRSAPNPMKIDHRNPHLSNSKDDLNFARDRDALLQEMDGMVQQMEQDNAAGQPLRSFPPVRAGRKETIPNSASFMGNLCSADNPGPNLGKLVQHLMPNLLKAMKNNIKIDRKTLEGFLKKCP
ncbi:MAG: DUF2974 domain-containing protein [bacterium]|nr:DUF2974 domain-containing protein [bacterium]